MAELDDEKARMKRNVLEETGGWGVYSGGDCSCIFCCVKYTSPLVSGFYAWLNYDLLKVFLAKDLLLLLQVNSLRC